MIEIRHKESGRVMRRVRLASLAGARLRGFKLRGADLRSVDLRGADLRGADLQDADMAGANLNGASLVEVGRGARGDDALQLHLWLGLLSVAALVATTWWPRFPPGPYSILGWLAGLLCIGLAVVLYYKRPWHSEPPGLRHAKLQRASLQRCYLPGAALDHADLSEATLSDADLMGASLHGATLRGADLTRSRLDGVDLQQADLRDANLQDAHLRGADLRGADLRGADLRAHLNGADLHGARYDDTTRWPASFQPARHGAVASSEVVPAVSPRGAGSEASAARSPGV